MGQQRTITGSRILITGASQGIGKALAELAAARGAKVLGLRRKVELLHEVAQQIRAKDGVIEIVQADITSADDRKKLLEAADRAFGGLDILINNAGIGATGHFADCSAERLRQIMEVNFFGLTETTRAFLPMLKKGNKPAIVNISSIAGKRGIPARSEYSASKFAVQGFQRSVTSRAGERRRRCAGRLSRLDADQFLRQHDRAKGPRPARPHARHECGGRRPANRQGNRKGLQ